jgi:hypothetical protein
MPVIVYRFHITDKSILHTAHYTVGMGCCEWQYIRVHYERLYVTDIVLNILR